MPVGTERAEVVSGANVGAGGEGEGGVKVAKCAVTVVGVNGDVEEFISIMSTPSTQ